MSKYKKDRVRAKHEFLLTFLNPEPHYQEKEINGCWLVKYHNGITGNWEVMIFTSQDAFENYKAYTETFKKQDNKSSLFSG